ncbi:MAG TPA: hypothetical protein VFS41_00520 [Edaphobacter sp.]|nr:hypothetical protein [Edaphobacter sp.]
MTTRALRNEGQPESLPNGPGAAAVLSMGVGSLSMAVLAIAADHSPAFKKMMIFYTPTGPLSGVTTTAIVVWMVCWIVLDVAWKRQNVSGSMVHVGLYLLAIGFILMFPPVGDLF